MIFAVGTFVQRMACHIGEDYPFIHGACFLAGLHVLGGKPVVFKYLLDDNVAGVTRFVQVFV